MKRGGHGKGNTAGGLAGNRSTVYANVMRTAFGNLRLFRERDSGLGAVLDAAADELGVLDRDILA